ncbi:hypothetical protein MP228_002384 [Amoeboaphelidium protococcarum]|nr:hypothetical protein MP228_002384 [Amoeboaphelidium protococcarum]
MPCKLHTKREAIRESFEKWNASAVIKSAIQNPQYDQILSAQCADITSKILSKQWTAVEVVKVYCHKALEVHNKINCLTEIMFDRALQKAKALDEEFAATGKARGLLHGVPVSIKDHVEVAGYDSTSGYSKFALDKFEQDAVIIQLLEEQGAIPFVKTNVCQFMMTFESSNPLYGRTDNPHNPDYVSGGSSSGEGALIGAGGSVLGLGGDVAGSLRIPAHMCGIYTLKPSYGRLPLTGNSHCGADGMHEILPTFGPMARSINDLELFMKAVIDLNPHERDPLTTFYHKPYTQVDFGDKPLKIGYYTQNDVLTVSPACVRATEIVIDSLKKQGHELVPFKIPDSFDACKKFYLFVGADGMKTYLSDLKSDPLQPELKLLMAAFRVPTFIKKAVAFLLRLFGEERAAELLCSMKEISIQELYALQHELFLYRKKFYDYWNNSGVDFVVAPGFPFPATPHGSFSDTSIAGWHTALYNFPIPILRQPKTLRQIFVAQKKGRLHVGLADWTIKERDCDAAHGSVLQVYRVQMKQNCQMLKSNKIRTANCLPL